MDSTKIAAIDFCSRLMERADVGDYASLNSAVEQVLDVVSLELQRLGEEGAANNLIISKEVARIAFDRVVESAGTSNILHFGSY